MGLPAIDFRMRQQRCGQLMGADAALLLVSPPMQYRNSTVESIWRQESFFYFLTGFAEPGSAVLMLTDAQGSLTTHLFLREKDELAEMWNGRRLGVKAAQASLPVDHVMPITDLWEKLPGLIGTSQKAYFGFDVDADADLNVLKALATHKQRFGKKGLSARIPLFDAQTLAGSLRLKKDAAEIARMRQAAHISSLAFDKVFRTLRPGMNERTVYATLLEQFYGNGADMEAYGSIVAGGEQACILHYRDNSALLNNGELLLIDAGCQFEYYASDITRTMPIGSKFSKIQADVYDLVLAAQMKSLECAQPGRSLEEVHQASVEVLTQGLIDFRLLNGSLDENIENMHYKRFFPHGTSHWIGMDVHDVGIYYDQSQPVRLIEGMYFSVEPGLYFSPADDLPTELCGIGIRIEDDVLVTATGHEVITSAVPKSIKDIEHLRSQAFEV